MKARLEDQGKCGIYRIYHKETNKSYIGKSVNVYERITSHISGIRRKSKDENRYLTNAWFKYGKDLFDYEIIEELDKDSDILKNKELEYMIQYNSLDKSSGYNLRMDSSGGMIPHEETKKLMSETRKKRYQDNPELKEKIGKAASEFWSNNPEKIQIMSEKVRLLKTKFSILQYDMDMNFIEEFFGFKDISNKYPDFYRPAIYSVCRGEKNSYKSFKWRYRDKSNDEIIQIEEVKVQTPKSKKLPTKTYNVYSVENELLYEGLTARELVPHFNVCYSSVLQWVKNSSLALNRGYIIHIKI